MKRRNFLQGMLGAIGIGTVCVPKAKSSSPPTSTTTSSDSLNVYRSGIKEVMEFPDKILALDYYQDQLIVSCEHSVWTLAQINGEWQKKRICV